MKYIVELEAENIYKLLKSKKRIELIATITYPGTLNLSLLKTTKQTKKKKIIWNNLQLNPSKSLNSCLLCLRLSNIWL